MPNNAKPEDYELLGRAAEQVLIHDYTTLLHKPYRRWWHSFVAGLFGGLGGVIGATLMVGLLLLLLQQLGALPFIGHYFQTISQTIKK